MMTWKISQKKRVYKDVRYTSTAHAFACCAQHERTNVFISFCMQVKMVFIFEAFDF